MADYNSGLPIRSEADGVDEKVLVKLVDGQMGGSHQMAIDADRNAHVEMHGNEPDGTTDIVLQLSQEGRANPRGDYDVSTNTKPASIAQVLHARTASPAEANQTFRPTGVASSDGSNAKAADVAIRDEAGNAFTVDNPLPVTWVDSEGTEVNDYKATTDTAAASSDNHDYTVTTLKRLKLSQIQLSASGKCKAELQIEDGIAADTFTTKFVAFNSTANPNASIPVNENITVAAGVRVRVIMTNLDNAAQNLYSTICGHEIT